MENKTKDHETEIKQQLINERENRVIIDRYQAWYNSVHNYEPFLNRSEK
jgi:hypothetical protein